MVKQHVKNLGCMVDTMDDKEKAELEEVHKRRVVETIKAFSEFGKKLPGNIPRINSLAVASRDERIIQVTEDKMTQKLAAR
ncbi:hypothetical protein NL676_007244 [Syzygium grande]|nr:hypothetical protein NL676_007244 [Syzygium grande]